SYRAKALLSNFVAGSSVKSPPSANGGIWAVAQLLTTRRKSAPNDDTAPMFHRRFDTLFFPRRNGRTRRAAVWASGAILRSRGRKPAGILPRIPYLSGRKSRRS